MESGEDEEEGWRSVYEEKALRGRGEEGLKRGERCRRGDREGRGVEKGRWVEKTEG